MLYVGVEHATINNLSTNAFDLSVDSNDTCGLRANTGANRLELEHSDNQAGLIAGVLDFDRTPA